MLNPQTLTQQELEDLDYSTLSKEEIESFKTFAKNCASQEQSIKLTINSIYGAFGNEFFHFYNSDIAETITLQGQEAIRHTEKMIEMYFHEIFHKDVELHKKLGVPEGYVVPKIKGTIYKYGDTDSVEKSSTVIDNVLGELTIEEFFKFYSKNGYTVDLNQNEVITLNEDFVKILNWNDKLKWSSVKHIIRHKVKKQKWKVVSKSGKFIEITDDHSIMVLRNGVKIKIKASEIDVKNDLLIGVKKL